LTADYRSFDGTESSGDYVIAFDRFRLDGKVAVLSGASTGLGVRFARVLSEAGADLAIGARRTHLLEETRSVVEGLGRRCVATTMDVSKPGDCEALIDAAVRELGDVHVLVNNAGVGHAAPAYKDDPRHFQTVLDVNLAGAYYMSRAFGRVCIERRHGGSIVNVSSALAVSGSDIPQAAYSASKAGMLGLTRDLAMQWSGRFGIRVNALAPGFFMSALTEPLLANPSAAAKVLARTPMGRLGAEGELDGALLLLASDAGSYITGITLAVDGGWSLH
jgi:NAD(P)-dependent dehydrogenase (short-subunit alcohol dehydrogenase family)